MQRLCVLSVFLLASIIGVQSVDYVQINATGAVPPALYWQSCWIQGNSFVVFGGTTYPSILNSGTGAYQASLHFLDLTTLTWTTGTAMNAYTVVNTGDSVVQVGNLTYVWAGSTHVGTAPGTGGNVASASRISAFTVYDENASAFSFTPNPLVPPFGANNATTNSRGLATAVVTPNGGIAVFGGSEATNPFFNDFYEFNITAQTWTNLNQATDPNIPSPRSGMATTVYKGVMYLFGGRNALSAFNDLYSYDFATGLWSTLSPNGTIPSGRFSVANSLADDGTWVFFGGSGPAANTFFNDTFYLNLNTLVWSTPTVGVRPSSRTYHCSAQNGNTFYYFGGTNNDTTLNDVWSYTYVGAPATSATATGTANTATGTGTSNTANTAGTSATQSTESGSSFSTQGSDASKFGLVIGFVLFVLACL